MLSFDELKKLSEEYGDAFYLLDSDVFENNYKKLTEAFKKYYSEFNIAYSYKTNYTPKLCKIVNGFGGFAEVVSDMEMEIALKCGVSPEKIIWNGPVKNYGKVKELLLAGGIVNIDSSDEFNFIKSIAESLKDKKINIGLRCNYDVGDAVVSRFGLDVESDEFESILANLTSNQNINLAMLQVHYAKRNPEFWSARTKGILDVYDKIAEKYGLKPNLIDLGGGIYGNMPESLKIQLGVKNISFEDYAEKSAKLFAEKFQDSNGKPVLLVEPGSALAGDSMRYICQVKSIKTVRGKTFATVSGSQKNISMSGVNPPIEVFSSGKNQTDYSDLNIVGYTCIEGDVLQKDYCGKLAVGDFVVVRNCGSYSVVMKPPFIFPNVPIIDISGEGFELIKRAETFDDLFKTFQF
jgi:diaminopimelate decarboxylase